MAVDPALLQGEIHDGSEDPPPELAQQVEQLLAGFLRALMDERTQEKTP